MAKRKPISVQVPDSVLRRAQGAVREGQYASVDDVVVDALRLWATHHRNRSEMDRLIEVGIRDAEAGRVMEGDAFFRRLSRRRNARRNRAA